MLSDALTSRLARLSTNRAAKLSAPIWMPSSSLQAWAILRHIDHIDALADYTFTGNISAWRIALGNGAVDETYVGAWSDGVSVVPTGATDIPNPSNYPTGPFVADWNLVANPRLRFPLVSGPPQISGLSVATGQAMFTVSGLPIDHNYLEQVCSDFGTVNWSNALSFVATQSSQSFTNAIGNSVREFWRIQVP